MATHRITEDIERRMFEYLRARGKGQNQWDYTFGDCVDELLKEAGF